MLSYLIWNGNPEIIALGPFSLRWYGLLFALGFLISQQILYYIYRTEGKPEKDVDTLTVYMVIATILGARLGHVVFYQPEMFLEDPLGVFLPFQFSPFRFTGFTGIASHGGAIGILLALWIYSRYSITFSKTDVALVDAKDESGEVKKKEKKGLFITRRNKEGQSYLQVLDRIVILVALTGALIRTGNYFNSEIIGKPYNGPTSVVFTGRITEAIMSEGQESKPIDFMEIKKNKDLPAGQLGRVPIDIYLLFKPGTTEPEARRFVYSHVQFYLNRLTDFVDEPAGNTLNFQLMTEPSGTLATRITTFGIARHPAQLYEAISCVLLFLVLLGIWFKYKKDLPEGRIFGIFMIILWTLRFSYEFLKENQVRFEDSLPLNMGQILSIPLVLVGVVVLIYSFSDKAKRLNPQS